MQRACLKAAAAARQATVAVTEPTQPKCAHPTLHPTMQVHKVDTTVSYKLVEG